MYRKVQEFTGVGSDGDEPGIKTNLSIKMLKTYARQKRLTKKTISLFLLEGTTWILNFQIF